MRQWLPTDYAMALEEWLTFSDSIPVSKSNQRSWDNLNISVNVASLNFDSDQDKARFLASTRPESNFWLAASKHLGTLLDNNTFRISIALRIGTDILYYN